MTEPDPNNHICPACGKSFPKFYWGVSGRYGGFGTHKKPGIAKANFIRHKKACTAKSERNSNCEAQA